MTGEVPNSVSVGLTAYFNGDVMPLAEAAEAMKAAGLESAGGFYDVERTFGGTLYRLEDHLARLYRGLKFSGLDPGMAQDKMAELTMQLMESNVPLLEPGQDFLVTQVVSVTPAPEDSEDAAEPDADGEDSVNIAIYCQFLDFAPFALSYGYGVRVTTPVTYAVPPAALSKRQQNYPLMSDAEGNITECQGGNFMFVKDGRIKLPDRSNVLPGVSMKTVLELAERIGVEVDEGDYNAGDIYCADEGFVSSTRFCMVPVATINGLGIGAEMPGPVTRRLQDAWIEQVGIDFVKQALDHASGAGLM
jgi:branched-chain amino acid aminotransferase